MTTPTLDPKTEDVDLSEDWTDAAYEGWPILVTQREPADR